MKQIMFLLHVVISLVVFISMCECVGNNTSTKICPNVRAPLASVRKRRHLVFPDGSNMVLTISLVKAFMTHAPAGWNIALEIDVMFPLPDAKTTNRYFNKKLHHKQKRELWERLQDAIDYHNMNGQACVLRSICEAKNYLAPPGRSLVHDILRSVFTAPIEDEEFMEEIGDKFGMLSDPHHCQDISDCPFSLLGFVLSLNKQYY